MAGYFRAGVVVDYGASHHGQGSSSHEHARCARCNGYVWFDTDTLGRLIERCDLCEGVRKPSPAKRYAHARNVPLTSADTWDYVATHPGATSREIADSRNDDPVRVANLMRHLWRSFTRAPAPSRRPSMLTYGYTVIPGTRPKARRMQRGAAR